MAGVTADDDGDLRLVVQLLRHVGVAVNGAAVGDGQIHPLAEVDGLVFPHQGGVEPGGLLGVVGKVHAQADDVVGGPGNGGQELHLRKGDALGAQIRGDTGADQLFHGGELPQGDDALPRQHAHQLFIVVGKGDEFHGVTSHFDWEYYTFLWVELQGGFRAPM